MRAGASMSAADRGSGAYSSRHRSSHLKETRNILEWPCNLVSVSVNITEGF
jgi:hypothetical protein